MYVGNLCELLAQPQEQRGGQGTAVSPCLAAVPCPSLMKHSKLEIPNKTFILDSHSPFICSVFNNTLPNEKKPTKPKQQKNNKVPGPDSISAVYIACKLN